MYVCMDVCVPVSFHVYVFIFVINVYNLFAKGKPSHTELDLANEKEIEKYRIDKQFELEKLKVEASNEARIREHEFMRSMFSMFCPTPPATPPTPTTPTLPTSSRKPWVYPVTQVQKSEKQLDFEEYERDLTQGTDDFIPFDLNASK